MFLGIDLLLQEKNGKSYMLQEMVVGASRVEWMVGAWR